MINACALHIGCLLTCVSGEEVLNIDLIAQQTGDHIIEYHFLETVTRFTLAATQDVAFAIPDTYFNEAADAKIKIIQPDNTYLVFTHEGRDYDAFLITVKPGIEI